MLSAVDGNVCHASWACCNPLGGSKVQEGVRVACDLGHIPRRLSHFRPRLTHIKARAVLAYGMSTVMPIAAAATAGAIVALSVSYFVANKIVGA